MQKLTFTTFSEFVRVVGSNAPHALVFDGEPPNKRMELTAHAVYGMILSPA